jgi:hypothetical protein
MWELHCRKCEILKTLLDIICYIFFQGNERNYQSTLKHFRGRLILRLKSIF